MMTRIACTQPRGSNSQGALTQYDWHVILFSSRRAHGSDTPCQCRAGAHGRVDRVRTRPTFRFFFFFFVFRGERLCQGLKLNEIEHYKLDKSKGRFPRETFFVSRFSPAFPHARRRHPSLRYNFSRHLLSIFHVIYILSTYKTH